MRDLEYQMKLQNARMAAEMGIEIPENYLARNPYAIDYTPYEKLGYVHVKFDYEGKYHEGYRDKTGEIVVAWEGFAHFSHFQIDPKKLDPKKINIVR